jgi:acetyltransferase EpsM
MGKNVIIWGASGHALVVADILRLTGRKVLAYIDDVTPLRQGKVFGGARVFDSLEKIDFSQSTDSISVALGIGDNQARSRIARLLRSDEYSIATAIHPNSVISAEVAAGEGIVVAAGVVVNPGSSLGDWAIVNTSASIDHECVIGDYAHIAPGARLAGRVVVGAGTMIGVGAAVKDRVTIGSNSIIGAGSVVIDDIPDNVVAYGCPAKIKKSTIMYDE